MKALKYDFQWTVNKLKKFLHEAKSTGKGLWDFSNKVIPIVKQLSDAITKCNITSGVEGAKNALRLAEEFLRDDRRLTTKLVDRRAKQYLFRQMFRKQNIIYGGSFTLGRNKI